MDRDLDFCISVSEATNFEVDQSVFEIPESYHIQDNGRNVHLQDEDYEIMQFAIQQSLLESSRSQVGCQPGPLGLIHPALPPPHSTSWGNVLCWSFHKACYVRDPASVGWHHVFRQTFCQVYQCSCCVIAPPPGVLYSLVPLTFTSVKQSLQGVLWILISDAAIVCLSGLVSGVREWKPRLEVFPF